MALTSLLSWLGVRDVQTPEHTPLRDLVASLDQLEPERARHLARFAYLLGRVALADRHASDEETRVMEHLVAEHAGVTPDQATMVVGLARNSNLLFGGTADYNVVREFSESASYDDKLGLARCLFTVASSDDAISLSEEAEIHRIVNQLKILPEDLTSLRVLHRDLLPGRSGPKTPTQG
jgi:uncharacterized tellurite resistance protein B-like protein